MDKRQFQELLDKYLAGTCSEEEERILHEFYESFQNDMTWDESRLGPEDRVMARIKADIDRKIERAERRTRTSGNRTAFQYFARVAAVLLIVVSIGIGGGYMYLDQQPEPAMVEKVTRAGQRSILVLSDGSEIRLNSESKITFPETFGERAREVTLEGEAFFEVAHNLEKPFVVRTGDLTTTVLGTSFNIKAFSKEEDIEVTVATGKVRVEAGETTSPSQGRAGDSKTSAGQGDPDGALSGGAAGGRAMILVPNQQARFDLASGTLEKREVNLSDYLAWKDGKIIFDKIPLAEAADILERWFNVDIVLESEALGDRLIRSEYNDENLVNILESMKYIMGVDYRFDDDNRIVISGESNNTERGK